MGAFRSKDDLEVHILVEPSGMQSDHHALAFPSVDHDGMASGCDDCLGLPCMDVG